MVEYDLGKRWYFVGKKEPHYHHYSRFGRQPGMQDAHLGREWLFDHASGTGGGEGTVRGTKMLRSSSAR